MFSENAMKRSNIKLTGEYQMLKRIFSALLAVILVFSLASCGKKKKAEKFSKELKLPDKKVAILVAPEAQYPEDYRAAKALEAQYPDNVIVKEYADSRVLVAGDAEIITLSKELAADETVGAIVYARATQFTNSAIQRAKEINDSLYTVAVEPEQSLSDIYSSANLVLCADWMKYSKDIVDTAKDLGAEYFILFSYDRHVASNPLYSQLKKSIADECYNKRVEFVFENFQDPNFAGGVEKAKYAIRDRIVKLFDSKQIKGENIALFSTDSVVQSVLVEEAAKRSLIYVSPSFPTPYNGIGEYYDITLPEDMTDTETYFETVSAKINGDTEGSGKFALYTYTLASTLTRAAVYSAFDLLSGEAKAETVVDSASVRLKDACANKKFNIEKYGPAEKGNVLMCYAPGYDIIKQEKEK